MLSFFRFFVAVNAETERRKKVEKYIDAACYGTRIVQRMKILRHSSRKLYPFFLRRFRNLVTRRIHDDRRMIIIFIDHIYKIFLPPFFHIRSIVETGFMNIPTVRIFIQHQHSQSVTCIQSRFRTRIVCRAHRVISHGFQKLYFSSVGKGMSRGSQKTVVAVNTRAAKNYPLSVQCKSFRPTHRNLTNAERDFAFIFTVYDFKRIKFRIIRTPKLRVFNLKSGLFPDFCSAFIQCFFSVAYGEQNFLIGGNIL